MTTSQPILKHIASGNIPQSSSPKSPPPHPQPMEISAPDIPSSKQESVLPVAAAAAATTANSPTSPRVRAPYQRTSTMTTRNHGRKPQQLDPVAQEEQDSTGKRLTAPSAFQSSPIFKYLSKRLQMVPTGIDNLLRQSQYILDWDIENDLEPRLTWLQQRLLTGDAKLGVLLATNPSLLRYHPQRNLEPTLQFLQYECMGGDWEATRAKVFHDSSILGASLDQRLQPRLNQFIAAGLAVIEFRTDSSLLHAMKRSTPAQWARLLQDKVSEKQQKDSLPHDSTGYDNLNDWYELAQKREAQGYDYWPLTELLVSSDSSSQEDDSSESGASLEGFDPISPRRDRPLSSPSKRKNSFASKARYDSDEEDSAEEESDNEWSSPPGPWQEYSPRNRHNRDTSDRKRSATSPKPSRSRSSSSKQKAGKKSDAKLSPKKKRTLMNNASPGPGATKKSKNSRSDFFSNSSKPKKTSSKKSSKMSGPALGKKTWGDDFEIFPPVLDKVFLNMGEIDELRDQEDRIPLPRDVICGRTHVQISMHWPGNLFFHHVLHKNWKAYNSTKVMHGKKNLTILVREHISLNGGCFLHWDKDKKIWIELDDRRCFLKIAQAFRDIRKSAKRDGIVILSKEAKQFWQQRQEKCESEYKHKL